MSMTDPIADYLTRVRNAIRAGHRRVDIPVSKMRMEISRILRDQKFINDFAIGGEGRESRIRIFLRYHDSKPVIRGLERVSTPGLRTYVGVDDVPRVLSGLGIAIVSTPKGLLTDSEARREHVGGEVLCKVW